MPTGTSPPPASSSPSPTVHTRDVEVHPRRPPPDGRGRPRGKGARGAIAETLPAAGRVLDRAFPGEQRAPAYRREPTRAALRRGARSFARWWTPAPVLRRTRRRARVGGQAIANGASWTVKVAVRPVTVVLARVRWGLGSLAGAMERPSRRRRAQGERARASMSAGRAGICPAPRSRSLR